MKFKIGDRTVASDNSFKDEIIDIKIGQYIVKILESKLHNLINDTVYVPIVPYDNFYNIDKEYIWNEQLREILTEG